MLICCLSLVIVSKEPQFLVFLIIASLPTIIFPLVTYRFFFSLSLQQLSYFPHFAQFVNYPLAIFAFYPNMEGRDNHFSVVRTSSDESVALKSDPLLILANGAGALLEGGPGLCHLWTTHIQAINFMDVFSGPSAPH